jgi:hypothetical protein
MSSNPILDELHAIRAQLQAEAGDDLHRIVEEARQRTLASGRPIVGPLRGLVRPVNPPLNADLGTDPLPSSSLGANQK